MTEIVEAVAMAGPAGLHLTALRPSAADALQVADGYTAEVLIGGGRGRRFDRAVTPTTQ
ncbi:MAG TPA: hypothetical protein VGR21_06480 [Cryptosporangiaceae bacterium]|nr:hypothetical protein [Cryptosporangiaceae bacterium]